MELGIEREFFILSKRKGGAPFLLYDELKLNLERLFQKNRVLKSQFLFLSMTRELDSSMIEFRGRCGHKLADIQAFLEAQELAMQSIERAMSVYFSPHSLVQAAKYAQKTRKIDMISDILGYFSSSHIHFGAKDEKDVIRIYKKLKRAIFEDRIFSFLFASERVALLAGHFPELMMPPDLNSYMDAFRCEYGIKQGIIQTPFLRVRERYGTVELRLLDSTRDIQLLSEQISTIARFVI